MTTITVSHKYLCGIYVGLNILNFNLVYIIFLLIILISNINYVDSSVGYFLLLFDFCYDHL